MADGRMDRRRTAHQPRQDATVRRRQGSPVVDRPRGNVGEAGAAREVDTIGFGFGRPARAWRPPGFDRVARDSFEKNVYE